MGLLHKMLVGGATNLGILEEELAELVLALHGAHHETTEHVRAHFNCFLLGPVTHQAADRK